jgi:hypothetical protein
VSATAQNLEQAMVVKRIVMNNILEHTSSNAD